MKKIKKFLELIKFQYNSIWNTLHYYRMIRKAKFKKWASRNKHSIFFVIPFSKTTLGVIDQTQRRDYNRMALKEGLRKLSHNDLIRGSYYCTGQIINLK